MMTSTASAKREGSESHVTLKTERFRQVMRSFVVAVKSLKTVLVELESGPDSDAKVDSVAAGKPKGLLQAGGSPDRLGSLQYAKQEVVMMVAGE
jgi:hypothetical protein